MSGRWLLLGNLIYVVLQWAIVSVISKEYDAESLGQYFFALALSAPVFLLFSLKLPTLLVTHSKGQDYPHLLSLRGGTSLLAGIFVVATWGLFFQDHSSAGIVFSVVAFKTMEQFDDLEAASHQKEKVFKRVFLIKVHRGAAYFLAVILGSCLLGRLADALLLATGMYAAYWGVRNFAVIRQLRFDWKVMRDFLRLGLPLGASVALGSVVVSLSRMYVGVELGAGLLAVYGAIGYVDVAFGLVVAAMGQFYLPFFVDLRPEPRALVRKVVESQSICIGIGIVAIGISFFLGRQVLAIAYNDKIAEYSHCLVMLFLATTLRASSALLGTAVTATGKYSFQLPFSLASALSILLLLPFFVGNYGLDGAFYSLVITALLEWVLYLVFSFKYFGRMSHADFQETR